MNSHVSRLGGYWNEKEENNNNKYLQHEENWHLNKIVSANSRIYFNMPKMRRREA